MRIKAEDTMALVIDFQEKLMPVIHQNEEIIQNAEKLVKGLTILDIPMVITQQYTKGLGMTVDSIREAVGEKFEFVDKLSFSCVDEAEVMDKVKGSNKKNIILCGAEAHICVLQTVMDLIGQGYQVILVTDCIGSRKIYDKEMGIHRAAMEGAILTTYESILFELTGIAGTEKFKKISKLIK